MQWILNKVPRPRKRPHKTVLADANTVTVTVITIFYIKEQNVINSHRDDRI
jgi:hypothetical protein